MHIELPAAAFILGTAFFVLVARRAIVDPRCHGFYRFFAFEALLVLVVLDMREWFSRSWSVSQIVGTVFLNLSGILALHAFLVLVRRGKPDMAGADEREFGFEHTTVLVKTGAFRFIRHPMYTSLLLLAWGLAIKDLSPVRIALAMLVTVSMVRTALVEESENLARFGDVYREYMRGTRRFVPFVL